MSIEKRLERLEAIVDARGLDWDHPRVEKEPAKESLKKWRILEPGEVVCSGDRVSAKTNPPSDPPDGLGWIPVIASVGASVCQDDPCIFARLVADEPAKEALLDGLPDIRTFAQPNLRWRILEQGEGVQEGDWYADASDPRRCWPPSKGAWLQVKVDLVKVGEVATSGLVFARPVTDEPASETDHPAGPKPDPGEGYRILSKDPPEELAEGDEFWFQAKWYRSAWSDAYIKDQEKNLWYRRKIEAPKPAWEPKVGDWVRVTRPQNWCADSCWSPQMHQFDGKVGKIENESQGRFHICGFAWPNGLRFSFNRDWLSPAEPPASEKPPEPEYREPVLPADGGMECEFSEEGDFWSSGRLGGVRIGRGWFSTGGVCWRHCRIKKDA